MNLTRHSESDRHFAGTSWYNYLSLLHERTRVHCKRLDLSLSFLVLTFSCLSFSRACGLLVLVCSRCQNLLSLAMLCKRRFPRHRCHIIGIMTPASCFEVLCDVLVFASPCMFTLAASLNVALAMHDKATKLYLQSLIKIERSGNRPFCSYYAAVLAGLGSCTYRHYLHKDPYLMWQSSLDREATHKKVAVLLTVKPHRQSYWQVLAGP